MELFWHMMNFNLLKKYQNGNYEVRIYHDGSKIRLTKAEEFSPLFPESIDLKITNYCDLGCKMCHEKSSLDGKHALLNHLFLDTLCAGTELAIGGGNPLAHPDLKAFLIRMKSQGVICNLTVNVIHLFQFHNTESIPSRLQTWTSNHVYLFPVRNYQSRPDYSMSIL